MHAKDLQQDPLIVEWMSSYKVKRTAELYLTAVRYYTDFLGKMPAQILEEAEDDIRNGVLPRKRKIKADIIAYRSFLINSGLADWTVNSRLAGVKAFYRYFDIDLPQMPMIGKIRGKEENKEIPTKEDIRDALKVCNLLERAVILVGVSSGLAANEIRNLTLKRFFDGYDSETEICTLDLRRRKTGTDFITFLSPEATRAIKAYIEYRQRPLKSYHANRAVQLEKQRVTKDGYLFILQNIPGAYLETRDEGLRQINEDAFKKLYRGISEKAQKSTEAGKWNLIRSHNMRKYFNSVLLNAGADSFFTEYLMGHTMDDTRAAYFRASPEKLRDLYKKFIPYLTIQKELNVSESPEFLKLKGENEVLAREAVKATVEREEIVKLREELEQIKKVNEYVYQLRQIIERSDDAKKIMRKLEK